MANLPRLIRVTPAAPKTVRRIERVISAEQLKAGYVVFDGLAVRRHDYGGVRPLFDGTYLVYEPETADLG